MPYGKGGFYRFGFPNIWITLKKGVEKVHTRWFPADCPIFIYVTASSYQNKNISDIKS